MKKKQLLSFLNFFYKNKIIFYFYKIYNHSYLRVLFIYLKFKEVDIIPYLVYSKKKLVYVPVPKVATTSITHVLHKQGNFNSYFTKKVKGDYYYFSIVRNPFSRIISGYKCCILHPTNSFSLKYYAKRYKKNKISFKRFVKNISKIKDEFSDAHFKSQQSILFKKYNKHKMNYIGKLENLDHDFKYIQKKFNLKELPLTNVTKEKGEDWRDYYTPELAELVYKRYKKDFDLWYPDAYDELKKYLIKKNIK